MKDRLTSSFELFFQLIAQAGTVAASSPSLFRGDGYRLIFSFFHAGLTTNLVTVCLWTFSYPRVPGLRVH